MAPTRNRLHIYRRACFGAHGRGPRYEPLSRAPFAQRAQGPCELSSLPAAGLTCGDDLRSRLRVGRGIWLSGGGALAQVTAWQRCLGHMVKPSANGRSGSGARSSARPAPIPYTMRRTHLNVFLEGTCHGQRRAAQQQDGEEAQEGHQRTQGFVIRFHAADGADDLRHAQRQAEEQVSRSADGRPPKRLIRVGGSATTAGSRG